MKYDFTPKGVCSRGIHVELDGDVIRSVKFDGGCNGNTQGVAALAVGMTVDEYVKRCKGITGRSARRAEEGIRNLLKRNYPERNSFRVFLCLGLIFPQNTV